MLNVFTKQGINGSKVYIYIKLHFIYKKRETDKRNIGKLEM